MISDADIALRLAVAALLGSMVGFERERLLWSAGIRTHMLVSVGACLLMIVSAYGFQHATTLPHVVLDPSRIAAQVVSGIGFLGAGSILLRGQAIRGMTTAASIWSVAALGLAAGGGLYFAAGVTTVIILVILAGLKPLEEAYRARVQSCVIRITAERGALSEEQLRRYSACGAVKSAGCWSRLPKRSWRCSPSTSSACLRPTSAPVLRACTSSPACKR